MSEFLNNSLPVAVLFFSLFKLLFFETVIHIEIKPVCFTTSFQSQISLVCWNLSRGLTNSVPQNLVFFVFNSDLPARPTQCPFVQGSLLCLNSTSRALNGLFLGGQGWIALCVFGQFANLAGFLMVRRHQLNATLNGGDSVISVFFVTWEKQAPNWTIKTEGLTSSALIWVSSRAGTETGHRDFIAWKLNFALPVVEP